MDLVFEEDMAPALLIAQMAKAAEVRFSDDKRSELLAATAPQRDMMLEASKWINANLPWWRRTLWASAKDEHYNVYGVRLKRSGRWIVKFYADSPDSDGWWESAKPGTLEELRYLANVPPVAIASAVAELALKHGISSRLSVFAR